MNRETPPFVEAETEKLILGACLIRDGAAALFADEGIREQHFFSRHHQLVWRRIRQALSDGIVPDFPIVRILLAQHGELEEVGVAYLANLTDGVVRLHPENANVLARRLIQCAVGRETMQLFQKAQTHLLEQPTLLTDGFFSHVGASLRSLSAQLDGRRLPDHVSHVSEVMEEVRASLQAGPPEFVDTPYPALNSMLGGGFAPGELVFLGARPGLGKTAAALEIARRVGKRGHTVVVVSREMLKIAVGTRMLAQEGPVNATSLRKRDLTLNHWSTIELAIEKLQALPIFVTHENVDITAIRRLVGAFVDEGPLGLLIVDYLQLIDAPKGVRDRRLQVEAVSAGLKALTLDYSIPVLCLSSLSRPPDGRAPTLASLRESGNLEHDADTVILLHRPKELEAQTQVIVAKSRNGRTGMVEMFFRGEYLRFEEPAGSSHGA